MSRDTDVGTSSSGNRRHNQTLSLVPDYDEPLRPGMAGYLADPPGLNREYPDPPVQMDHTATSILHITQLPTLKVYLNQALAGSITNISPWKNPAEWIRANHEYISSVVKDVAKLAGYNENELTSCVDQSILYPRLVAYAFSHLMLCPKDQSELHSFNKLLQEWKTWDSVTMIRLHHTIKRCIIRTFEHLQPFCGSHMRALDEIMAYDIVDLSARLTVIVNDDDGFVAMINLPRAEGHSLVNLLQARLDFWIEPEYKGRHIRALVQLSRITAQYPDYMSLRGIGIEYGPAAGNGFGEVCRGRLGGQKLAIKVLRVLRRMKDTKSMQGTFLRKAVTWRQLSHPNVLPFLGLYRLERSPPLMCLLTPWAENGNLAEYLNKLPNTNCLHLSLDIAQGLEYLHGMKIVHGNLKGPNILISPSGRACLADTGQAAPKNIEDLLMTGTTLGTEGTLKWRAPELLLAKSNDDTRLVTQATDVYAFAMVCYEMFSGELPFRDFSDQKLASALVQGERPPRPFHPLSILRGLDDDMWDVIEMCWNQDAEKRPEASQVVECLRQFLRFVIDNRPPHSNMAPKSLMWYKQEDHPFCALAPAPEDNDTLKRLKRISKGDNSGLADNNQIYPPSTYIEDADDDIRSSTPEEPPEPLTISIDLIHLDLSDQDSMDVDFT